MFLLSRFHRPSGEIFPLGEGENGKVFGEVNHEGTKEAACLQEIVRVRSGLGYVEPSINSNVHDGNTGVTSDPTAWKCPPASTADVYAVDLRHQT